MHYPRTLVAVAFAAVAMLISVTQTFAQTTEENWQLLNRIVEASNSVSPETAREAHKECVAIGKEVAARTDLHPTERLYFESEVESCIAYAMNNGQFSDESGDECDHHFRSAQLVRDSILSAQNQPGVVEEQFLNMRDRLQRASEIGPDLGCQGDYEGLIASLPEKDALAIAAGIPNEEIQRRFATVKGGITAEGADDAVAACRALGTEVQQSGSLHAVEYTYFDAMTEDCIASAMVHGGKADEVGDACAHHHLYATNLFVTLLMDKETKYLDDNFQKFVSHELETALRQGPGMGCTQDYAGLKIE